MARRRHNLLAPSHAERWINCHGYLKLTEGLPRTSNKYADEGTTAHARLELCGMLSLDPWEVCPEDEHMAEAVETALRVVARWQRHMPGSVVFWESHVEWDDVDGTCDIAVVSPWTMVALDFKYGKGVAVDVVENEQLLIYLAGLRQLFGRRKSYTIGIIQPRAWHTGGRTRYEVVSDHELDVFLEKAAVAVVRNHARTYPPTSGDHCRWCPAQSFCPAYNKRIDQWYKQ